MEGREKDEKQGQASQDWAVTLCGGMAAQKKSDEGSERKRVIFPPPFVIAPCLSVLLCDPFRLPPWV